MEENSCDEGAAADGQELPVLGEELSDLADDGLAVLSPDRLAALIDAAEAKLRLEAEWTRKLAEGVEVGHIFGLRYVGMLYGIVFLGHQIGGFLGAWLGGRIFDLSGSYLIAWWLSIARSVMAAALSLPVREAPLLRAQAQ